MVLNSLPPPPLPAHLTAWLVIEYGMVPKALPLLELRDDRALTRLAMGVCVYLHLG